MPEGIVIESARPKACPDTTWSVFACTGHA